MELMQPEMNKNESVKEGIFNWIHFHSNRQCKHKIIINFLLLHIHLTNKVSTKNEKKMKTK